MILADAAAGGGASTATTARATPRGRAPRVEVITAIEHERAAVVVVRLRAARTEAGRRACVASGLDDVDGLRALVAVFLFVCDFDAFGERAVAVAGDAGVVH